MIVIQSNADLAEEDIVDVPHIAEAIEYRTLDGHLFLY